MGRERLADVQGWPQRAPGLSLAPGLFLMIHPIFPHPSLPSSHPSHGPQKETCQGIALQGVVFTDIYQSTCQRQISREGAQQHVTSSSCTLTVCVLLVTLEITRSEGQLFLFILFTLPNLALHDVQQYVIVWHHPAHCGVSFWQLLFPHFSTRCLCFKDKSWVGILQCHRI